WANLVVWLDNPAIAKPTILATSVSISQLSRVYMLGTEYLIDKPPKTSDIIDGTTPKLRYDEDERGGWHTVFQFHEEGTYQDLIQWDQLTDAAREALNKLEYGDYTNVPFNDAHFEDNLKSAATYYEYKGRWNGGTIKHSIWENSSPLLE
ncbi:Necrosis inducing protein NPP1, partial [Phytophthora megakarya]